MKRITFILAAILLFSSCKSYMMSTVSSPNTLLDKSTGTFNLKNDSLELSYNFSGDDAPLKIEIYNKLNEPLYVNWEKSAVILGDKAYSFVDDKLKIQGTTTTLLPYIQPYFDGIYTESTTLGTIQLSKSESFIPPSSRITRISGILSPPEMNSVDKSSFHRIPQNLSDGSGIVYTKEGEFDQKNSPLTFRTYITFYTLKDNQPKSFFLEQDFYVSKMTQTNADPQNIEGFDKKAGNIIIEGRPTAYGKAMSAVILTGAAVGATAVAQSINKSNNNK